MRWRWAVIPLLAFAASRVLTLTGFWVGIKVGQLHVPLHYVVLDWDGSYYRDLARDGYPTVISAGAKSTIAFFPLFSLLIRWTSDATHLGIVNSANLVTTVFGAAFFLVLWRLTATLTTNEIADRTAVLTAFFPGTFVFSMQYSEPLFLTLAAACLLFLHKRQWLWAGIVAAVATGTRSGGIAIVGACAVASAVAIYRDREWKSLVAPVLSPLGTIAYFAYLKEHTGHWDEWFRAEKGWQEHFDFGVTNLHRLHHGLVHPSSDFNVTIAAVGLCAAIIGVGFVIAWRPPAPIWVFTAGILLEAAGSHNVWLRPRFLLTAFPMLIAVAKFSKGNVFAGITACMGGLLAMCAMVVGGSILMTP